MSRLQTGHSNHCVKPNTYVQHSSLHGWEQIQLSRMLSNCSGKKRKERGWLWILCISYVHYRALSQPFLGDVCLVWSAKGQQYTVVRWEVMWKRKPLHACSKVCNKRDICNKMQSWIQTPQHKWNENISSDKCYGGYFRNLLRDTNPNEWLMRTHISDRHYNFFFVCLVLRVTCKPCPPHIISVRWLWVPNPHGNCHNHQTLHNKLHERCKDELFQ